VSFRIVSAHALLVALVAGCAHVAPPAADESSGPLAQVISPGSFDRALLGRAIFGETNRVRSQHGVPPLAPSPGLDSAADEQASWMALMFRSEHGNPIPGEHTVADRIAHAGIVGLRAGENVLMMPAQRPAGPLRQDYTYAALAAFLVDSWLHSPAHRANLLDRGYTHLGCAARFAHGVMPGDQRVFAAQVFLTAFPKNASK